MDRKKLTIIALISIIGLIVLIVVLATPKDKEIEEIYEAQVGGVVSEEGLAIKKELIAPLAGESGTLFISEDFEIGYLTPPLERFMVFIYMEDLESGEDQAVNWLKSRGFSENDLCGLPVIITPAKLDSSFGEELPDSHLPSFCNNN